MAAEFSKGSKSMKRWLNRLARRQSYNSWSGLPGLPDLPRLHGASSASGLPRVLRSIGPIGSRVDCAPTVLCLVVSSESEGADFFKFHFSDIVAGVKCWVDLGPKFFFYWLSARST